MAKGTLSFHDNSRIEEIIYNELSYVRMPHDQSQNGFSGKKLRIESTHISDPIDIKLKEIR